MRRITGWAFLAVPALCWLAIAQVEPDLRGPRLKRDQMEALLKDDHKKSLSDATELIKLSEELKIELEKADQHVLSVAAMKKTEEIEKLAKRIRGRMRRF